MRRSAAVLALVVGLVVVAGCSSAGGTAESASSPASTAAAPGFPAPGSAAADTSNDPSAASSVPPIALDDQTINWFDTLCTGLSASVQTLDTTGKGLTDPSVSQDAIVAAVKSAGTSFGVTASALSSAAPPTFDGGAELASTVAAGLNTASVTFPQDAATFAALDPNDAAGLTTGRSNLQNQLLLTLSAPLKSVSALPQGILNTVKAIPSCQPLTG